MATTFNYIPFEAITPAVPLDLDRRRHVRLGKRAILRAEKALCDFWGQPRNILSVLADSNRLTLNDIAIILWQGLVHEDPALTLEQAQDLLDVSKLETIVSAIFEAWNLASQPAEPANGEVSQGGDPLGTPSPGTASGATPVLS